MSKMFIWLFFILDEAVFSGNVSRGILTARSFTSTQNFHKNLDNCHLSLDRASESSWLLGSPADDRFGLSQIVARKKEKENSQIKLSSLLAVQTVQK